MSGEHKHTYVCENCGNEANLIIKEEESSQSLFMEGTADPGE